MLGKFQFLVLPILILLAISSPSLIENRSIGVDYTDYFILSVLQDYPPGLVLTHPVQGVAIYSITGNRAVATQVFNNVRSDEAKSWLINCHDSRVRYIYADFELECGELIFSKNYRYLYKLR